MTKEQYEELQQRLGAIDNRFTVLEDRLNIAEEAINAGSEEFSSAEVVSLPGGVDKSNESVRFPGKTLEYERGFISAENGVPREVNACQNYQIGYADAVKAKG